MKRIGVLFHVTVLALIAAAVFPPSAQVAPPSPEASRAATFVGLKDGETLFVERVRDVPGGFHGEVSMPGGMVWVRYRVALGPDEAIRRYELDMAPRPGDVPRPMLVARRERDSVLIEPERGMGVPGCREAVPPSAFMGSTEMAVFEQAIRYGLRRGGPRPEFPIISAWTGKRMDAALARSGGDKVRLESTQDVWEFTLDGQRRISSGTRLQGRAAQAVDPWVGIRVVRLDPALR